MKIVFALFFAFLFLNIPPALHAQSKRTLINVPVIVSDREGRRVPGLRREDFTLFQGGVQQTITGFETEDEPVSVALLLDTSGSTQNFLSKIREAAKDFIDLMNPKDQCMIATFDSSVNILIPFSSNKDELKKSLDKIQTADKEGSIMFSAVDQIVRHSFSKVQGRKAMVLLSDGKDFGSSVSRRDLLSGLEESDVSIYPIFYQSGIGFNKPVVAPEGTITEGKEVEKPKKVKKPKKRKKVYSVLIPVSGDTYSTEEIKLIDKAATTGAVSSLKELSDLTAGGFYSSDDEKLSTIFRQVAAELRQQYLISFYFEGPSNTVRDISVRVNRPDAVVQTRTKTSSIDF